MFADDTILHTSGKTITGIEENLNNDLEKVVNWCADNNMAINTGKTKTMLITTSQKASTMDKVDLAIKSKDVPLTASACEKLLCVYELC